VTKDDGDVAIGTAGAAEATGEATGAIGVAGAAAKVKRY
jgi:hypothetical protein